MVIAGQTENILCYSKEHAEPSVVCSRPAVKTLTQDKTNYTITK